MVTRGYFCKLIADFDEHSIRKRNAFLENTSMIPGASIHGYRWSNGVNDSTCTNPLVIMLTSANVLDIGCSVVTLAKRTTCSISFLSTASTLPFAVLVFLAVVY